MIAPLKPCFNVAGVWGCSDGIISGLRSRGKDRLFITVLPKLSVGSKSKKIVSMIRETPACVLMQWT